MLRISLQFFAHKKGVGSTKNGRDSESKRLGVKKSDGRLCSPGTSSFAREAPIFIPVTASARARMIPCSPSSTAR